MNQNQPNIRTEAEKITGVKFEEVNYIARICLPFYGRCNL